jgi:hypothetical protein
MERDPWVTCAHCFDRIGVYEPIFAIDRGRTRRATSLAGEPTLIDTDTNLVLLHERCAAAYRPPGAVD